MFVKNKTTERVKNSAENIQRVTSSQATRDELVVYKGQKHPSVLSNMVLDLQLVDAIRVDAKPADCRHGFQWSV